MNQARGVIVRSDAPAPRTLLDILRESARLSPDASAIEDPAGALSYRELMAAVISVAARLHAAGVRRGDRVGVRMRSGSRDLYVAILGVIAAGAAYVPVDADDPEERATLVFGEAAVRGVIGDGGYVAWSTDDDGRADVSDDADAPYATDASGSPAAAGAGREASEILPVAMPHPSTANLPLVTPPRPEDDAWIIFTSGSTGTPKGVAVSHRSAAAFVDAEAELFLQDEPISPADRVLAGLSVAFDASCEEMWLAWRHGACLVPAPRSLVRSGMDLGPWLAANRITIVSTVPTLASLWPADALDSVRLLIFGGEACPPDLVNRLAVEGREVWNTYGPTEATVVATAAIMHPGEPVRIGLPLAGWEVAVVDADGSPVGDGESGELIIGGVGLARYLDPAKDAEKYAPMPSLGWERAYRSGDLVRFDRDGLFYQGRADDQVKVGGRRIELGEIEAALQDLPGVGGAAVAVRKSEAGNDVLVGYLAVPDREAFSRRDAIARLREELPAALVPMLALVDDLPVRTSGKVDRAALPWPIEDDEPTDVGDDPVAEALAADWRSVLGIAPSSPDDNFFDLGGGSLAAAQLVSLVRRRHPDATVADIYAHPRFGSMVGFLAEASPEASAASTHEVPPTPRRMQVVQTLLGVPLFILNGVRWLLYLLTASAILRPLGGFDALPEVSIPWLVVGLLVFVTPWGRMAVAVVVARLLLAGLRPGDYPRGGSVHLRLWLADQVAHQIGAASLAGAPWISYYARALGAKIGPGVDLHALPPITGMLEIGAGASIEPEVDLAGTWIDGDVVRVGAIRVGAGSSVGARSSLMPGARIGKNATVAPGSAVFGRVPAGQNWAGSPAIRVGKSHAWWPAERPPAATRWVWAYGVASTVVSLVPVVSFAAGAAVLALFVRGSADLAQFALGALAGLVPATAVAGIVLAGLVVVLVRLLGIGLDEGVYPVRSRVGWQVWATERLLDLSRTILFPLYSSLFTPTWLRMLGAEIGRDVEASTVLLLPAMTSVGDGAFLADDTLVASYELGGGYVRLARANIGARAFVGNSGMAPGGNRVPRDSLVAVLSVAPRKAKAGTSWLGSPPVKLRRQAQDADASRTYDPPYRLRVARTIWELLRAVPVIVTNALGLAVLLALAAVIEAWGPWAAVGLSGPILLAAGFAAAAVSTIAKWLLIGRIKAGEHPLWSSFVWRSEVSDTFTEMVAAPWFAHAMAGTPALVWWLRSLGAKIGRGVWIDSYWLPEADLVTLGDAATVNRGCVVQTHLFHDRIMSMDEVVIERGGTLGPHSVILPAARIGEHATVGPASLVMRGEGVPDRGRWSGNPIGPWRDVVVGRYVRTA
ncbi:amino acid adenylation domain-containing protein [Agromyces protaetiae]|uniref:Amino acid adenylation domain-containing protein n=1 Tax=Agromyces protaetiae TaxID=2509455 RepID=A0A4P6FC78_9MICO|nr:Pls/PosA family non-ribosomal peptide synthetase [Agromyces protaetiae]QAY72543.1 amino acid adenylation domain-containing protein [Agromyces protaetiae]